MEATSECREVRLACWGSIKDHNLMYYRFKSSQTFINPSPLVEGNFGDVDEERAEQSEVQWA